jgi:hypothetical protein
MAAFGYSISITFEQQQQLGWSSNSFQSAIAAFAWSIQYQQRAASLGNGWAVAALQFTPAVFAVL